MTKGAALQSFFAGFSIPAYPAAAVPSGAKFPYLTYDAVFDAFPGGEVSITANLWYYTDSEAEPNAKAQELSAAIGYSGVTLSCDDGYIWLKRGSPFCQSLSDAADHNIKRRYINISAEYLTHN